MASVNFMKIKDLGHLRGCLRHGARTSDKHRNEHIDPERKNWNEQLYGYGEAVRRFRSRLEYLDAQPKANKREGRVLAFGLELPIPKALQAAPWYVRYDWLSDAYEVIEGRCGAENIIDAYVHGDEIHDYRDARTGRLEVSREHLHVYSMAVVDGKLNGKKFSSEAAMKAMNKAIDDMTREKYAEYGARFLEGSQPEGGVSWGKSVEWLKAESTTVREAVEAVEQQTEALDIREAAAQRKAARLDKRSQDVANREAAVWQREQEAERDSETICRQWEDLHNAQAALEADVEDVPEFKAYRKARKAAQDALEAQERDRREQEDQEARKAEERRKTALEAVTLADVGKMFRRAGYPLELRDDARDAQKETARQTIQRVERREAARVPSSWDEMMAKLAETDAQAASGPSVEWSANVPG